MKCSLPIFFAIGILSANYLHAQQNVFFRNYSTDSNGFRSASAVYFDNKGQISSFTKDQLSINEGGQQARIISVTCSPPGKTTPVSSVLTIDISGSMRFGGPNIRLAQEAANAWVDALDNESEAAITVFDHSAFLESDFTDDKEHLKATINLLRPRGGTNYERGLLDSVMGSLSIGRNGRQRRVVVFLTDGFGTVDPDTVIERAHRDSITIYCVTLGLNMPGVLQRIAEETGGLWFDNVTTVQQAVMAYQRIFSDATGAGGCTVVWDPPTQCSNTTSFVGKVQDATYETMLDVPGTRQGGINVSRPVVQFKSSSDTSQYFILYNRSVPTTITAIANERPDVFYIQTPPLPLTIAANDSIRVFVRCKKVDSTYVVGRITLETAPCPSPVLYMSSGDPSATPSRQTLRVVRPNGGERIPIRSYYPLAWEGLPPDVPVKVEISKDAGRTWSVESENKTDLGTSWHTGNEVSDSCLLRVTHLQPTPIKDEPIFSLAGGQYSDVVFSNDGKFLATGETAKLIGSSTLQPPVTLWDGKSGKQLLRLGQGSSVAFTADNTGLMTWGRDTVSFYAVPSGQILWRLPVKTLPTSCVISRDGSTVVIGGGENDETLVVDARTGAVRTKLRRRWTSIQSVDVNYDGSMVAVCEKDSMVSVFSTNAPDHPRVLSDRTTPVYYRATFSPDGARLLTTDGLGYAKVWDTKTLQQPTVIATRAFRNDNAYVAFTPDGNRVAVESDRDETKVIDVATGNHLVSIRRLQEPGGASDAIILPDNRTLILSTLSFATAFDVQTGVQMLRVQKGYGTPTAPADGTRMAVINSRMFVDVYNLKTPVLQQDVSDSYWALYRAIASIHPVRLRQCAVGQSVDSIVSAAITNTGKDSVTVRGMRIEGLQAADFGLNAPKEFVIGPNESFNITYSFHPNAVGERAALIVAETNSGIINARISGRCMGGVLKAGAESRFLGTVQVGRSVTLPVNNMIKNEGLQKIWVTSMSIVGSLDNTFHLIDNGEFALEPGEEHDFDIHVTAPSVGIHTANIAFTVNGIDDPIEARVYVLADTMVRYALVDPTTFRTIILPSANVPKAGTVTTGVYDVLGLSLGYSVTDNVAILAGGVLPLYRKWLGATGYQASYSTAWSVGAKVGYPVGDRLIVGGGYQYGQSLYDQEPSTAIDSKITFNALWSSVGYGDDDSRLNCYLGYAFKHHNTLANGRFNADATILGFGYDYRLADNWKVCFETVYMRTMDMIPATIVGRYFRENDAFEFGLTYIGITPNGKPTNGWPLLPMLSWVKRW